MKASSGPSEHPETATGLHFAPVSPSYQNYHPEWTSVSPSTLAPSVNDPPKFYSAPPRKKICHLLNPPFRSSCNSQDETHPSATSLSKTTSGNLNSASHTYSPSLHSPSELLPKATCSTSPHDANASPSFPFPDDHEHGPYKYSAVTQPHAIMMEEDRIISSRPLKNTKRAAQNRAAQRAFRERKDRYVRELEARSTQFEEYILRYGLLEERERLIEAREAELMCRKTTAGSSRGMLSKENSSQSTAKEEESVIYGSTKTSENERNNYVAKLEDQLEDSRREITRLRSELLKVTDQDEVMHKGNQRVSDWEKGSEEGFTRPRTGSASDVDTGEPASCSPSSSHAWSTPKVPSGTHRHREWVRNDRISGHNSQKTSDEGNSSNGFNGNRKLSFAAITEKQRECLRTEESSRFGWSDGSRSPVSFSLSYQQKHSARGGQDLSADRDRMSYHRLPAPKLHYHEPPLRRSNTLERQDKMVRLPAIHHHLSQIWGEEDWKR